MVGYETQLTGIQTEIQTDGVLVNGQFYLLEDLTQTDICSKPDQFISILMSYKQK